ncbi:GYDIA family GHMP kinase [Flavobacterium sp.]|uniref:GYDIA family GHMP kinase n=1 Tax=Flavobacterium sp. TaxID=239 RepID=UPI0028BD3214|nr:GYDIA family GHMP kinase [Flavobacterium sp.]
MNKKFYSNGKLLITGEYVVLDGASALALPTTFGQSLQIESGSEKKIIWKSYDSDGSLWYEDNLTYQEVIAYQKENQQSSIKATLLQILNEAYKMNPSFMDASDGYSVSTHLTFPRNWGLGTSSTLINNIAQWAQIDAYELLKSSFGGSGYDIACAQNDTPILYQLIDNKPLVEQKELSFSFSEHIYFVYLNQKQNSREAIKNYYEKQASIQPVITEINSLTQRLIHSQSIGEFTAILEEHEQIMSAVLETKTVKERLFPDFSRTLKSLGAWGGDFIMVISTENPTKYFKEKGFETILTYSEMIK